MNDATVKADGDRLRSEIDSTSWIRRVLFGPEDDRDEQESPEVIKLMACHAPLSV